MNEMTKLRTIEGGEVSHRARTISLRNAGSRFLSTPATLHQEQERNDQKHLMIALPPPLVPGLLLQEHAMESH